MTPLRLLFVVQRYGAEVRGGAEQAARTVAERLAERGHLVEVLTTTARSYVDWSGDLCAGTEVIRGVTVHRLPVDPQRDPDVFNRLNHRVVAAVPPVAVDLEAQWITAQGPSVPELTPWLDAHAARFDVAVFFTYLYATTTDGLPAAARHTATALVPCAHDEPPLALHVFDRVAHLADSLLFLTPEEAELVLSRFRLRTPHHLVGLGTELRPPLPDRTASFREDHGLDGHPYLLYVGRIDPSKGTSWLVEQFAALKAAEPSPLKLVLIGEAVAAPDPHPDVLIVTDADDAERNAAMATALALVHPSPFESFGMVVTEAWALQTPIIAFGGNDVLRGHVERSGGGLLVTSGAELGAAVELLMADSRVARALGDAGRRHVEAHHAWPSVIDRWERALHRTAVSPRSKEAHPVDASSPVDAREDEGPTRPDDDSRHPIADGARGRPSVREDLPPSWFVRPLAMVLGLVAGLCVVGVVAAMAEVFEPGIVVVGTLALGGPLGWLAARAVPKWSSSWSTHAAAAVVLVVVGAITMHNGVNHSQHVVADRDPGVYLTTAKHLVDEGDLLVPGPTGPFEDASGVSPNGAGFSNERHDGTLEPQFPHLTSVLLAAAGWISGSGLFVLTPLIAGGALICLYAWATTVVGPRWALAPVVITGVSMPFMVFARDAYSEPIATVLIFGGLWLLHIADLTGRRAAWLLAGLVLGASAMARVDGFLYAAPVVLALALVARLASPSRRRQAVVAICACAVGLVVTGIIGFWDTATFTGGYYDAGLRPRLPAMLGAAVLAGAVGWIAGPWLWRRRAGEVEPTPWLRAMLSATAVGLALFFAWGWWIRPNAGDIPDVAAEGLNVLSYLPQAATLSLHWLAWYLSPLGLAVGLAGLLWALVRLGRGGRPAPATIAGLGAIFVTLLLYLWTPSVTPDHPWAMRRFAPVAIPGLALGVAVLGQAIWRLGARTPNLLRQGAAVAVAIGVVGGTAGATAAITWPVREVRAQVPMRERINDVCSVIDEDDAILVPIDGILSLMLSVPIGVWCGVPSVGGLPAIEPAHVAEMAVAWAEEGRDLVVVSSSATPLMNELLPTGISDAAIVTPPVFPKAIEPTITRRPDEIVVDGRLGKGPAGEVTFYVYRIDVERARRFLETGQPVDPGS